MQASPVNNNVQEIPVNNNVEREIEELELSSSHPSADMGYEMKEEQLQQLPQLASLLQPQVQELEIQRVVEMQRVALAEAKAEADKTFEHQSSTNILKC